MHPLAEELNSILDKTAAGRLLSSFGRRIYFPKGIIAQSGEAKKQAHRANATIGMAYKDGGPLMLKSIASFMPSFSPDEAVAYAPTAGLEEARLAWKQEMVRKNPSINGDAISLPAVIPGLTSGISYTADLFVDTDQAVLSAYPCWDNYALVIEGRRGGVLKGVPFFVPGRGLDLDAIASGCKEAAKGGQLRVLFNFPQNPSGYTPSIGEGEALVNIIGEAARGGADVLVMVDDAYFGLFYEDSLKESLFGRFAGLDERVLAVKIDGPTKEDYVWGFRMGFLTFGSRGMNVETYGALEKKLMGTIRSSVSCVNTPAQSIMLKTLADSETGKEKAACFRLMKRRYQAVRAFVDSRADHGILEALPFNSGYFMSFLCKGISAEKLRRELLAVHGIGTVALGPYLRVAFSCLEEEQIPGIFETIYKSAGEIQVRGL
ncbi:MAG: aminotransferase class I/II-fold pyridoxal phosphate-dependent enzyme [Spirochaetaceae bacterium]|jgi:aspartate/methionine/tyrosine aminotransferase|nr:aminotransferase class I/II-fold pyridoxal phosphate-dependent enzyme [Spirochaetaceae bacterium]